MTLKEAFRYQNKLSDIIRDAMHILNNDSNIVKVENTYLRKKVMPEAEDEKVVVVPETEYRDEITKVTEFLVYIFSMRKNGSIKRSTRRKMPLISISTVK